MVLFALKPQICFVLLKLFITLLTLQYFVLMISHAVSFNGLIKDQKQEAQSMGINCVSLQDLQLKEKVTEQMIFASAEEVTEERFRAGDFLPALLSLPLPKSPPQSPPLHFHAPKEFRKQTFSILTQQYLLLTPTMLFSG